MTLRYEIRESEEPLLDFIEQLAEHDIELYPIQEQAMLEFSSADGGLLLSVPTGSGKTLVAEAAMFEALCRGQTCYYTTPLVALTEQKFDEFRERFGEENVGMITGNKRINADAPLIVAVTEILTNRLLVKLSEGPKKVCDVVVFDEFHYLNDPDRGWVWESAVLLLPPETKLLMLSATVEKTVPFVAWLKQQRGKEFKLLETTERAVPLTHVWLEKLLEDAIEHMIDHDRVPCLVFAFDRAGCFSVANQMTSLSTGKLLSEDEQRRLQERLNEVDFSQGAGKRFRKLMNKGIGVHHAGVLPKWRSLVEELFTQKLLKFVVCTETLAAGVNLPARSVLLPELVKYSGGPKKKLLEPATAHQIFGRAGRPQFDTEGFVYVLAPRDEVKVRNWEERLKKLGRIPTKKELSKKPQLDPKAVRWNKDQYRKLREAPPAPLESTSLPSYGAFVFLLQQNELGDIIRLMQRRFTSPQHIEFALKRIAQMVANLQALEYIELEEVDDVDEEVTAAAEMTNRKVAAAAQNLAKWRISEVQLEQRIISSLSDDFENLLDFRGVHPLFGHWLSKRLKLANLQEKLAVLEALIVQPNTQAGPKPDWNLQEMGPLWEDVCTRIEALYEKQVAALREAGEFEGKEPDMVKQEKIAPVPPHLPGKLLWEFEHLLAEPEEIRVQPKEIARRILVYKIPFFRFIESEKLEMQEGGVYRYLLRLVLLARQFYKLTDELDYRKIEVRILKALEPIDPSFIAEWMEEHGIHLTRHELDELGIGDEEEVEAPADLRPPSAPSADASNEAEVEQDEYDDADESAEADSHGP